MPSKLKVVYILGHARSGSTILDIVLGQSPDAVSTGELCNFYRFGHIDPQYCSCGAMVKECDLWKPVSESLASMVGNSDFEQQFRRQRWFERRRYFAWHKLRPRNRSIEEAAYLKQLLSLYKSVAAVTGKQTIVDSSKSPIRLFWLRQLADAGQIDLKVIFIIRDGRGVAWSLKPAWIKNPAEGKQVDYKGSSTFRTACTWVFNGVENEFATRGVGRESCRLLRYEDLCADPVGTIEELARFLGLDALPMIAPILHPERELRSGHLVAGNRMRMAKRLKFEPNLEWLEKMPQSDRRIFWLLAGWYARRRGYSADGSLARAET